MTKVYLVTGSYWKGAEHQLVILATFTNKKLANYYREYKELSFKKNKFLDYEAAYFRVQEERISKIDWSQNVLELQMEELPY